MTTPPRPSSDDAPPEPRLQRMSMAAVPCLPMQAAWLTESPAFQSSDPALVRAAFLMLDRAWGSIPAATLPANPAVLSALLGLTEQQWAAHFERLSEGWELREGRLVHVGMYELALRIWTSQADALDHLSATAPLVAQAPEDFELLAQDAVKASPLKGKRRLPASFGLTLDLREWLRDTLYVGETGDQDFLMRKFIDWARNKNEKFADPVAGFRVFASREDLRRLPSRNARQAVAASSGDVFGRMTRFGNSGNSTIRSNRETLAEMRLERDGAVHAQAEQRSAA